MFVHMDSGSTLMSGAQLVASNVVPLPEVYDTHALFSTLIGPYEPLICGLIMIIVLISFMFGAHNTETIMSK